VRLRLRLIGALALVSAVVIAAAVSSRTASDGSASSRTSAPPAAATPTSTARPAAAPAPGLRPVRRVYGRGANAVAVVRPETAGRPLPGVLFLHGWGYHRARDYRKWITHLARRGNAVIVPKYQNGPRSDPAKVRGAMLRGVRTALRHVELEPGTLVVAGHSAGAAMAADYAAVARSRGLPRPLAVYVVYPGRRILGTPGIPAADLARIPASTRLLVLAGARDRIVGQVPAGELRAAATSIPASRRTLVVVQDARVADHLAPLRSSKVARRTFWRRLDRLIETARAGRTP
jgi:acetyl esterase/lipase